MRVICFAYAEMMSCAPTEIEYPQVPSEGWSSAPQDGMYSAAGEELRPLRELWGWPVKVL